MSDAYLVPAARHRVEDVIGGSRFIASCAQATDVDAAKAFVEEIRTEFPDATHTCFAFNAGPPGDTARVGCADDGEPKGTAGRPMLTALLHSGVGELAVTVTRYFGGTKLGTGGLVRAYSGSVSLLLDSLPTAEKLDLVRLEVAVSYSVVTILKRELTAYCAEIVEERFTDAAGFAIDLPRHLAAPFAGRLADLSSGQAVVTEKTD